MRTIWRFLHVGKAWPALALAAVLTTATIAASTPADAQWGWRRAARWGYGGYPAYYGSYYSYPRYYRYNYPYYGGYSYYTPGYSYSYPYYGGYSYYYPAYSSYYYPRYYGGGYVSTPWVSVGW